MAEATSVPVLEKVYLSDVEIHRQSPIASAEDLRARVLFHVLFSDELLIGDAQCLNTPLFRALVHPPEASATSVRADLGVLLDNGRIRVAVREGMTLREVRDSQKSRDVEHVPGLAYAEEMDRRTRRYAVPYSFGAVSGAFKSVLLSLLEEHLARAEGTTRRVLEESREWIRGQEPLYYKSLREWEAEYPRDAHGTPTEIVLVLDAIDRAAGEAYRRALPTALGAATAAPRGGTTLTAPASRRLLAERIALPAHMLDPFLLGRLPVDVLLEATEQPSRTALVQELSVLRSGAEPDLGLLQDAVEEFSGWIQAAFERTFRDTDESAWAVLGRQRNLMRLQVSEDMLTGTLGVGFDIPPEDEEDGYLDVHFAERGLPDTYGYDPDGDAGNPRALLRRTVLGAPVG
ncbi:hypothetical protein ACFYOV_02475 [Streptomyces sp. NPDC005931]|uniref:hypothetical protein n=1 Tax=Streptomyces sp. NPDC005931 TaxID=3364737 RepID=UPI003697BE25